MELYFYLFRGVSHPLRTVEKLFCLDLLETLKLVKFSRDFFPSLEWKGISTTMTKSFTVDLEAFACRNIGFRSHGTFMPNRRWTMLW